MSRRTELIEAIQRLSSNEGLRQPSAAEWLATQDAIARQPIEEPIAASHPGADIARIDLAPDEPIT